MDNPTLIQTFVEGLVNGQFVMLSNTDLRTELTFDSMQLLAREGLVSAAKLTTTPLSALVRQTSSYWELVHQAMLSQRFFPLTEVASARYYTYQRHDVPEGYIVHCTTAIELWRKCWQRGHGYCYAIPLDLLVLSRGPLGRKETWYPLKGIESGDGKLLIRFLGGGIELEGSDIVVWLEQSQQSSAKASNYKSRKLNSLLGSKYKKQIPVSGS